MWHILAGSRFVEGNSVYRLDFNFKWYKTVFNMCAPKWVWTAKLTCFLIGMIKQNKRTCVYGVIKDRHCIYRNWSVLYQRKRQRVIIFDIKWQYLTASDIWQRMIFAIVMAAQGNVCWLWVEHTACVYMRFWQTYEPRHDKTNKVSVRPAKTQISLVSAQSDQSLCCPHEESLGPSLPIKHTGKTLIRLGRQADLSLRWTHSHFVGFVISRLILLSTVS